MPIFACAKTGAYLAGADDGTIDAVSEFALKVGLAFQIVDDVLDVIGEERSTGKKAGTDISEGKPTLPVIYAMSDPVRGPRIKGTFTKDDPSDEDVETALELIRSTDSIERCMSKAKEIVDGAIPLLSCLKDSIYKDSLIGLARFIVSRDR
jgi:geranylgeranyl pyrophosphate synthase